MSVSKKIVWVVGTLTAVGGGEQLLFEGVNHYRSIGYDVHIITWSFDEEALFNGKYECKNIYILPSKKTIRSNVFQRAVYRALSLYSLRDKILTLNPELIICQNEYDAASVYLATVHTRIPCCLLIFGQTFQFPHDIAKYSLLFRKHLGEIVVSMAGYGETISRLPPKVGFLNRIANEIVCFIRFFAVRNSSSRFVLSKQVQWEITKMYKVDSMILKGAYTEEIFQYADVENRRGKMNISQSTKVFLSLSRLDKKKRIDLCIKAFHRLNDGDSLLLVGGKGEEASRLKTLVQDLGIEHKVRMLGYVDQTDVWGLKKMCDVFVSLDIADFDISAYEALALGTKVVWTDEIDMDENLQLSNNIYVAKPDVDSVAEAMMKAIDAQVVCDTDRMKRYTWSNYFNSILESQSRREREC